MDRRQVIQALTTVAGIGLAGCSSREGDDAVSDTPPRVSSADTTNGTPTRTPTATLAPTTTPTPKTAALGATPPYAETTKLAAASGASGALFGKAVATSDDGSTVIIGMPNERNPNNDPDGGTEQVGPNGIKITAQGSASVFTRDAEAWTQVAKLTPTDGEDFTTFGNDIALAGDGSTAIITSGNDRVYAFRNRSGAWTQTATLTDSDADINGNHVTSVAVSTDGSTALIGTRSGTLGKPPAGSAYVFRRAGGAWHQETQLTANDVDLGDEFGGSVTLSDDGTSAVVTAESDDDPNGRGGGSAYVFSVSGGSWKQTAKLAAADGEPRDYFGDSVAMSGDGTTAIVGSMGANNANGERAGSAYVFQRAAGSWRGETELTAGDGDSGDAFGWAIAASADGSRAIVTAGGDHTANGPDAGSAFLMSRDDGAWTQAAKLIPPDGDGGDRFGFSVAMSPDGSTAIIGAAGDDGPKGDRVGSAYVFD
jgi:hypothetical protein